MKSSIYLNRRVFVMDAQTKKNCNRGTALEWSVGQLQGGGGKGRGSSLETYLKFAIEAQSCIVPVYITLLYMQSTAEIVNQCPDLLSPRRKIWTILLSVFLKWFRFSLKTHG